VDTEVIAFDIHERDYYSDGSTEVELNNGQVSIEFYNDGRVMVTSNPWSPVVEYESLEQFVDRLMMEDEVSTDE
jgi:formate-dependent nitrite reductase cytochrome c552 subunit